MGRTGSGQHQDVLKTLLHTESNAKQRVEQAREMAKQLIQEAEGEAEAQVETARDEAEKTVQDAKAQRAEATESVPDIPSGDVDEFRQRAEDNLDAAVNCVIDWVTKPLDL